MKGAEITSDDTIDVALSRSQFRVEGAHTLDALLLLRHHPHDLLAHGRWDLGNLNGCLGSGGGGNRCLLLHRLGGSLLRRLGASGRASPRRGESLYGTTLSGSGTTTVGSFCPATTATDKRLCQGVAIGIIERMLTQVNESTGTELGALYILMALTLVSPGAREALPVLHQAAEYGPGPQA